jgi:hypothetical protein
VSFFFRLLFSWSTRRGTTRGAIVVVGEGGEKVGGCADGPMRCSTGIWIA